MISWRFGLIVIRVPRILGKRSARCIGITIRAALTKNALYFYVHYFADRGSVCASGVVFEFVGFHCVWLIVIVFHIVMGRSGGNRSCAQYLSGLTLQKYVYLSIYLSVELIAAREVTDIVSTCAHIGACGREAGRKGSPLWRTRPPPDTGRGRGPADTSYLAGKARFPRPNDAEDAGRGRSAGRFSGHAEFRQSGAAFRPGAPSDTKKGHPLEWPVPVRYDRRYYCLSAWQGLLNMSISPLSPE